MTIEQFDLIRFGKGMKARHPELGEGRIVGVDFNEKLITIVPDDNGIIGECVCRCENIELITE